MNLRSHLALPWVLIVAGVVLVWETTRLPFTAGSPVTDLLASVSALGCGVAAVVTAWKALRGVAQGPWSKALARVSVILALLLVAAAALVLAFIFLMCGNYWARDMCEEQVGDAHFPEFPSYAEEDPYLRVVVQMLREASP